jgi:hypothetical protein
MEICAERDEYALEVQRLRGLLSSRGEDLRKQHEQRQIDRHIILSKEDQLREEIERLSRSYEQLLEQIGYDVDTSSALRPHVRKPRPVVRPSSASSSARARHTQRGAPQPHTKHKAAQRPKSAHAPAERTHSRPVVAATDTHIPVTGTYASQKEQSSWASGLLNPGLAANHPIEQYMPKTRAQVEQRVRQSLTSMPERSTVRPESSYGVYMKRTMHEKSK